MADARPDIRAVFCEALDRKSPEELSQYLDAACGGDAKLRAQVEELLASHREGGKFLGGASPSRCETLDRPLAEGPGAQIGPYKLLQEIGLGGMGVVYMADQKEPVKRRVALKIIKPGMDTRQVVARFEAERHALAMMDHPNIARVLDAGTTDSGRPYFVMELVNGIPVTQYCDEQHLTPRERLELFIPICQAVQHAHQKGIIHRDIKPSNILVALYDGRPVPKVIDFGVAKATSQTLTERTMFTQLGQIVGTLEYMSPEQAQRNQLDIDTRSDIYSLGVLLYELLTGTTPFDKKRLRSAAWDEMLRIIREEEPPKPSTRLSDSQDSLPSISAQRQTEPAKLTKLVRGELDWIVMKALEKDRARRYETANGLGNDIQRYLNDEPVQACPPSAAYRFQKFARRNKGLLATAATMTAVLLLGAVVSTWQAVRATKAEHSAGELLVSEQQARREADLARDQEARQRQAAVDAQKVAENQRQLAEDEKKRAESERERAEANFAKARAAVDEYLNKVTESELLSVPGLQPLRRDLLTSAMKFYQEFTQARSGDHTIQADLAAAHYRLGRIQSELGDATGSKTALDEAIRLYEDLRQQGDKSLTVQFGLAQGYFFAHRYDDAVKHCEEILAADSKHAETRELLAETYNSLATGQEKSPAAEQVLQYHQKALALREGLVKEFPDEPKYLAALGSTVNNLAVELDDQGRGRDALAMFERATGYFAQAHDRVPQNVLWGNWTALGLTNVARKQAQFGLKGEALESFRRTVEVRQKLVFQNPAVPSLRGGLYGAYIAIGAYQRQLGDTVEANRSFRAAQDVLENIPHDTADELFALAAIYASLAAPGAKRAGTPQADAKESEERAKLAIETLRKAISAGYRNLQALKQYGLLDSIRERPEFKDIVASLEKTIQAENLAKRESKDEKQQLTDKQEAARLLRELAEKEPAEVRHQATLAASLRSIGLIQLGQKNYTEAEKSLNEALRIRESLKDKLPNDPSQQVEMVAVRIALGQVWWDTDRRPEAHRLWQECLRELEKIAAADRDNTALQDAVGHQERLICSEYAEVGLWALASQYALRSAELGRITDHWADTYFSLLLPAALGDDAFRKYWLALEEHRRKQFAEGRGSPSAAPETIQRVWTGTALPGAGMPAEEMIAVALQACEVQPANGFYRWCVAVAQYRAGKHHDALKTLQEHGLKGIWQSSPTDGIGLRAAVLCAAVHAALGEKEEARRILLEADGLYHRFCAGALGQLSANAALWRTGQFIWGEHLYALQIRREAWQATTGAAHPDDPWQRLIQARGYWLIGEKEKAEAELAATDAAAAKESELCLARARLFERFGQPERAEAEWQKVVDNAGKDPMPWIHRGRWYAERGEHEKADADFAKAASLTPDELNKFLEAGWWVVGPYPPNLAEFCPPELDPDPSKPVYVIDPKTGLSDEPMKWRRAATGDNGRLDVPDFLNGKDSSSLYALAYPYSPDERTLLLRVGAPNGVRIWWNGRLVLDTERASFAGVTGERVPVALRRGRNQVLLRVRSTSSFTLTLGDTPPDRALSMAEHGLWQEAAEAASPSAPDYLRFDAIRMALLTGDRQILDREGERILAVATGDSNLWNRLRAAGCLVTIDNPTLRQHGNAIEASLKERLTALRENNPEREQETFRVLAEYAVAAGKPDEAERLLGESAKPQTTVQPLRAIIKQQQQKHDEAVAALESGFQRAQQGGPPFWPTRVWFLLKLREAERLITGGTARTEKLLASDRQAALADWSRRDPATAAFDHLVGTFARGATAAGAAYPYLARGRRLVELKRWDEAEADFNKAFDLAPNDTDVVIARAVFYADRGQPDKAAIVLDRELRRLAGLDEGVRWLAQQRIAATAAVRPAVFERLVKFQPNEGRPWCTRMATLAWDGDFDAAREAATGLERFGYDPARAAVALLAGNTREFERIRDSRPRDWDPLWTTELLILAPTSEPVTSQLLGAAEQMLTNRPDDANVRCLWGIAQFRAHRLREALAEFESPAGASQRPESVPVRAMIHHQLGKQSEATRWLRQSELWMAWRRAEGAKPGACPVQPGVVDEVMLLRTAVLHREAKELIEGAGQPQVAAASTPQPAPAANPETKPASPRAAKPPAPQSTPNEKPEEKEEQKK